MDSKSLDTKAETLLSESKKLDYKKTFPFVDFLKILKDFRRFSKSVHDGLIHYLADYRFFIQKISKLEIYYF